jgi:acetyltransferase-like isoleucine patch superfamily enzyme
VNRITKRALLLLLRPVARIARSGAGLRRLWAHARLSSELRFRVDPSVVVLGVAEVHGTGRVRLGRNLYLYRGLYMETQGEGEIDIGSDVVISRGVHLAAFSRIEIGAGSMIGEYASIRDANHRASSQAALRHSGHTAKPIRIGTDVWIGRGVMVLAGVCIGDRAVVGANAVVTRDVAAGSVVAGAPARPLDRTASS